MWRSLRALLIAISISLSTPLALADRAPVHVADVAVSYRDLDLRKESDARTLLERIDRAAYSACGGNPKQYFTYETMPRHTTAVFMQCRRDSVARAVVATGAPLLTRAFEQRMNSPGEGASSRARSDARPDISRSR